VTKRSGVEANKLDSSPIFQQNARNISGYESCTWTMPWQPILGQNRPTPHSFENLAFQKGLVLQRQWAH